MVVLLQNVAKRINIFFSLSDITFYVIYAFADWKSLAGETTVYRSTPYFYSEIKFEQFWI